MSADPAAVPLFSHIFFHPDYYRWSRSRTGSAGATQLAEIAPGRGLYRQWGITPRPEDCSFSCPTPIILRSAQIATLNHAAPSRIQRWKPMEK